MSCVVAVHANEKCVRVFRSERVAMMHGQIMTNVFALIRGFRIQFAVTSCLDVTSLNDLRAHVSKQARFL